MDPLHAPLVEGLTPIMKEHLRVDDDRARLLAESFCRLTFEEPPRIFDEQTDIRALNEFRQALDNLVIKRDRLSWRTQEELAWNIIQGGFRLDCADPEATRQFMERFGKPNWQCFWDFFLRMNQFQRAIDGAIEGIQNTKAKTRAGRRSNLIGVEAIDTLRSIWKAERGKRAPAKDLNVASPFANFAAEVWEICDIGGDPRSALKAWAKYQIHT